MKLFTFSISHPQTEEKSVTAVVPARTVEDARYLLDKEFFFAQQLVNGYMFDVEFIRSAEAPPSMKRFDVMTVHMQDGRTFEKAFIPQK